MATISLEYDSSTHKAVVKMDGVEMPHVYSLSVDVYGDNAYVCVRQIEELQEGVMKETRICAAEQSQSTDYVDVEKTLVKEQSNQKMEQIVSDWFLNKDR